MPPDTITVISEAVFTANHLTDTDKQNIQENKLSTTKKQTTQNTAQQTYPGSVAFYETRQEPR